MSESDEQKVPKGSYEAGRRVHIPKNAGEPFVVYVNGIVQAPGEDYRIVGNDVVFSRQIIKEEVGMARWMAMFFGIFGTYRKDETVDLQFTRDGRTELASDLEIHE